jgi:hypothetical protein
LAIAVGGLVGGTLDLTQAIILFGEDILAIAAGLVGPQAFHGDAGTYILGCAAALLHCLLGGSHLLRSEPQAEILTEHPLVCGLFFGTAVELVMSLVVLPLSALDAMGPYTYRDLVSEFLVHLVATSGSCGLAPAGRRYEVTKPGWEITNLKSWLDWWAESHD